MVEQTTEYAGWKIGGLNVPRWLERGVRVLGATALTVFAPELPLFVDTAVASVPVEYRALATVAVSTVLKSIRMTIGSDGLWGKVFKYFPA